VSAKFFTSDTHFGDHRVLNIGRRPFASVTAMDQELVKLWNSRVRPQDEVWHLGDFGRAKLADSVFQKLRGRKHLITGNNDSEAVCALRWCSVQPYAELTINGRLIVLCHYPFRTWNAAHRGAVNLHGHSHGRLKPLRNQFDVGVDAQNFRPVLLDELVASDRATSSPGRKRT
jgi:calcineurin-like phosphoesterase family protein